MIPMCLEWIIASGSTSRWSYLHHILSTEDLENENNNLGSKSGSLGQIACGWSVERWLESGNSLHLREALCSDTSMDITAGFKALS